MNLKDATQLLKKSGYTVIKEQAMTIGDFDITCEYQGRDTNPYVIVTPLTPAGFNFLVTNIVNKKDKILQEVAIEDIFENDDNTVEFTFPITDFCDGDMCRDYENTVKSLIDRVLTRRANFLNRHAQGI